MHHRTLAPLPALAAVLVLAAGTPSSAPQLVGVLALAATIVIVAVRRWPRSDGRGGA